MIRRFYTRFLSLLVTCLYCITAVAMSEVQLEEGAAAQLTQEMQTQGVKGHFITPDKIRINYERFDRQCNDIAVILVPGWSESYLKYAELIHDLRQFHYCLYTYDHRGQGLSSRLLSNPRISYVKNFDDYVKDLKQFDEQIVRSHRYRKVYLLAHSMGGLVAVLYASGSNLPIDGLILSAPMLKINTDPWPEKVAFGLVTIFDWLGLGDHYALGQGDWREPPFTNNRLTHSRIRYEIYIALLRRRPALIIAGVSNRWIRTSIKGTWKVASAIPAIKQPVLLFQAGEDHFVINSAEDSFCNQVKSCTKFVYKNAWHELLRESDTIRNNVLIRIKQFLQTNSTPIAP